MKRLITFLLTLLMLFILNGRNVRAQQIVVSSSGTIKEDVFDTDFDFRVINLKKFFQKYNSPLSLYAKDFVQAADKYGLDYRLVPAISGVESTFGKRIPYKSYNAYGWANGKYKFTSWEDSIEIVSMTLRTKYVDKGAGSIYKIGRRYAPPSKTWSDKVTFFINKIDTLPVTFDI